MADRVTIRIPANTAHVGLVRATASALAALRDFTYDRITDLHANEFASDLSFIQGP